jgi:uncharacterized protein YpmS
MNSSMPTSDGGSAHKNRVNRVVRMSGLLLAVTLIGLQFILPWQTGQRIAEKIQNDWEISSRPTVKVEAFPFFKIWQGRFDQLVIAGSNTVFSDILIDEWEMRMQDVSIIADKEDRPEMKFVSGSGFAVISESAVGDYLKTYATNITDPKVVIHEDSITYVGHWNSGIIRVSFSATGYPYINDRGEVRLELERITVGPFDIPGMVRDITESFLLSSFANQPEFLFAEMKITEIILSEGHLRIVLIK